MIVVDTNIIAYFLLPTVYADSVDALFELEPEWVAPIIWKSEFRNVLTQCLRQKVISLEKSLQFQSLAETLFSEHDFHVPSSHVLTLAAKSSCSSYDCEFVALAQYLDVPLITQNKQVLQDFPEVAVSMADFLRDKFQPSA